MYFRSTSRFNPYSYDELVKPLLQYKAVYDAAEQDFSNLAAQTEAWKNLINREQNKKAYSMYKEFADSLNEALADFGKGMSITNRAKLLDLKRGYSSSIVPIANAYKTKLEHIKEQAKGKAAGLVYDTDATLTSLDDYIDNPSLQHQFADSNAGYKRVATAAAALSKKLSKTSVGRIDAYTKTFLQEHGYNESEIAQAIHDIHGALQGDGNVRGTGILQSILENEMNVSGVSGWKNKSAQADYFSRIAPALYNAVGQTDIKPMEDYGARLTAKANVSQRGRRAGQESNDRLSYRRINYVSSVEAKKANRAKIDLKNLKDLYDNIDSLVFDPSSFDIRKFNRLPSEDRTRKMSPNELAFSLENPDVSKGFSRGNVELINTISNTYGVPVDLTSKESALKSIANLYTTVENELNKSVEVNSIYTPNSTNISYVVEPWVNSVKTLAANAIIDGTKTGITDSKGKEVSPEDLGKIDENSVSSFTKINPSTNKVETWLTYTEYGDKNLKSIKLPREIPDMGDGKYIELADRVESNLRSNEYGEVSSNMDRIQSYFDAAANTRAETQPKTNKDIIFPYID